MRIGDVAGTHSHCDPNITLHCGTNYHYKLLLILAKETRTPINKKTNFIKSKIKYQLLSHVNICRIIVFRYKIIKTKARVGRYKIRLVRTFFTKERTKKEYFITRIEALTHMLRQMFALNLYPLSFVFDSSLILHCYFFNINITVVDMYFLISHYPVDQLLCNLL